MAKRLNTQEKEQAKVGLASGESIRSVAKKLKRSASTIMKYAENNLEVIQVKRAELAGEFEDLAKRALVISDEDLAKESAYRKTLIAKIASDGSNILRGMDHSEKMQPKVIVNISFNGRSMEGPTHKRTYEAVYGKLDD